jgi:hypothetical protein
VADSVTPPPSVDPTAVDTAAAPIDAIDLAAVDLDAVERDLRDVETALARLADGTYWTNDDRTAGQEPVNGPAS